MKGLRDGCGVVINTRCRASAMVMECACRSGRAERVWIAERDSANADRGARDAPIIGA